MKLPFFLFGLCLIGSFSELRAQKFEVDTLQYQGTSEKIINFVILGDGYTQDQLGQFAGDARKFTDYLFSQSPYSHYRQYFNVFIVKVPSRESGVKHPLIDPDCPKDKNDSLHKIIVDPLREQEDKKSAENDRRDKKDYIGDEEDKKDAAGDARNRNNFVPVSDPDNYFGSSFDNSGLHRLVVPKRQDAIRAVLAANFPHYDQAVILANSPFYGGSGGQFATATVNKASNDIAIHELGHSFARLADEYWPGLQFLAEDVNRSQYASIDKVPWSKWIGTNGIGVFPYGGLAPRSIWYRPTEYCKMQYLVAPFCSVCSEAIIERIHSLTDPILQLRPDTTAKIRTDTSRLFRARLARPDPNTLKVEWFLNGNIIARDIDSVIINPGLYLLGRNTLSIRVTDTTGLVKTDSHSSHRYERHWTIQNDTLRTLSRPSVRWGDTIETNSGNSAVLAVKSPKAGLTYNWFDKPSGKKPVASGAFFVTPPLSRTTTFYLEASWGKQKTTRTPVLVKVLPEITAPAEVKIENDAAGDTTTISIVNPDATCNYKWFGSDSDIRPINGSRGRGENNLRINREGTIVKVPKAMRPVVLYVMAVSRTTSAFSKRLRVEVGDQRK